MRSVALIAVASLAAVAWANPAAPTQNVCDESDVADLVNVLENPALGSAATAYCSSLLGGGAPVTVTKTSTDVIRHTVPATVKSTVTSTKTAGAAGSTVTVTVYSNCAIEGYAKQPAYHADTTAGVDNFVSCSAECSADSGCVSFAFGSGQCLLFNVSSINNVNAASTSPFAFFDRNCPISSASEPPQDLAARQIIIPPFISIGLPGRPTPSSSSSSVTLSISDPTLASEACSCMLTGGVGGQTKTVTAVKTVTSDVGGATATQVTTVFTTVTASGDYTTVTITTTA